MRLKPKRYVKERFPRAACVPLSHGGYAVRNLQDAELLGTGSTPVEAWTAAADRLLAQETPSQGA